MLKNRTFLTITIIYFLVSLCSPLSGQIRAKIKGLYFIPSEEIFREIYGSGLMEGIEIEISLKENIDFWSEINLFKKKGELSITKENTSLQILPLLAGFKYNFIFNKIIHPYVGVGGGCFFYKESNPIGEVKKSNFVWITKGGIIFYLNRLFFIEAQLGYMSCHVNPAGIKVNLGGLMLGLAWGVSF